MTRHEQLIEALQHNFGFDTFKGNQEEIINNLMDYKFIAAFMNNGVGRKNARRFAPMITRNEYFAQQISTTEHYQNSDIPEIVAALLKYSKVADKEDMLEQIATAVRRNTK